MRAILDICCGLDVHKESVVACILKPSELNNNEVESKIRTFGTFPDDLVELRKWIESEQCRHITMESTGVYWFSVYEELEQAFDGEVQLLVANARHLKKVPGRKTDVKDAEWIADLLRTGMLKASFVPTKYTRELRQLTRYRKNIVQDIGKQKNRIEKSLQSAGVKLSSILSDVFGVTGRNLIDVFIEKGQLSSENIETNTKFISSEKRNEVKRLLAVKLSLQNRNFLKMQMSYLDNIIDQLKIIEESLEEMTVSIQEESELLGSIPGIATTAATAILAEIGTDMGKFPTAEQICSWAGLAPGNNESAGKKKVHEQLMETHT
jgi:transposase